MESRRHEWGRGELAAARSKAERLPRQLQPGNARLQPAEVRTVLLESRRQALLRALFVRESGKPVDPPGKEDIAALPFQPHRLPRSAIIVLDGACDDSRPRPFGNRCRSLHCMSSRVADHRTPARKHRQYGGCGCQTCDTNGHSSRKMVNLCRYRYDWWRQGRRGRKSKTCDELKQEIEVQRCRLSRLSEASVGVSESLEVGTVMSEVVGSARGLTGVRYGAMMTVDELGRPGTV